MVSGMLVSVWDINSDNEIVNLSVKGTKLNNGAKIGISNVKVANL